MSTTKNGQRMIDRVVNAVEITLPTNSLTVVTHAIPGDDGGQAIVSHLIRKFQALVVNGKVIGNPLSMLTTSQNARFIAEAPYPSKPSDVLSAARIPPHFATHGLLILPGRGGLFELEVTNDVIAPAVYHAQPTAIALGDISNFSPDDYGVREFTELSDKVRRLVSFVESTYGRPVMFIATGGYGNVVDREPAWKRK